MHEEPGGSDGVDGEGGKALRNIVPKTEALTLRTIPLDAAHQTESFTCIRSERIQEFIRRLARKMSAQEYSRVFVWPFADDPTRIAAYYTLSSYIVQKKEFPKPVQNKMPKGIAAPVGLIGFMGRDDAAPKDMGPLLIRDAALRVRAVREHMAVWGLALHPENGKLAEWYEKQGFYRCQFDTALMYGPLARFLPEMPR